jgi:tetratricopeptide (TPR) repeat protein
MHSEKLNTFLLACLAVIVILIYTSTLTSPFIFDDEINVRDNHYLRLKHFSLQELKSAAFDSPISSRPVSNLSFALNYYLNGKNVVGFHLVNIVIHILCGLLLYFFVKVTLSIPAQGSDGEKYRWIPFFTAFIWLVHPIQTQSVTYIVQRMNSLASMFYVLSVLLYAKSRLATQVWQKRTLFGGCLLAGLMALGSKEIAATLPVFIILYEWYFFQDLSPAWIRRRLPILFGIFIFFVALAVLFLGNNPLGSILAGYDSRAFSLGQRLLTEFRVVVFYISLLVWPHPSRLNLDHDFPLSYSLVDPATTIVAIGAIAGMTVLAVCLAKKHRLFSFCIFWFLGNLAIESSVISLELIFEHRNYLPSMLAVLAAVLIVFRFVKPNWIGIALLVAVGILFTIWTYERNKTWENAITIWQDCAVKSPQKARPYNNLGVAHMGYGDLNKAIGYFSKALTIKPDYANAHYNLGTIFITKGMVPEGIGHLLETVRLAPRNRDALNNLASALIIDERFKEAMHYLKRALRIDPDFAPAHNNLGYAQRCEGNLKDAIYHLSKAIQINPDFAEAHNNLGLAFSDQQNYAKANYHFAEAVRILPSHVQAQNNLKLSKQIIDHQQSWGYEDGP